MAKGTLQIKYEKLVLDNLDLKERVKDLESLLDEIEAVSCGEKQIESDGVYDDSDGLLWIYKRIQALEGK